ncbi:MAG: ring-cleaving dioxygenase [Opitutaceae bacterium]|jgi:glyoxalase family protein
MNTPTGLHHITAIASDPQANVDFYTGLLGLRLVKKTVNFDDPSAYHLYYGDETGSPGSIVTFFYWPGHAAKGRVGTGQNTAIVFSAPATSLDFWQQRLQANHVTAERRSRFAEEVLTFADPDGIPVEIVAVTDDTRAGWTTDDIPVEHALRGLHTAELTVRAPQATEKLVTGLMGYRLDRRDGNRARYESASGGGSGHYIDIIADASAPAGLGGSGTIHHIAFSVPDDATQVVLQEQLHDAGHSVSDVRDRNYFHSIYYREPAGILFEIATANPGFAVDEAPANLGTALKLPTQFERARSQIERLLPPLRHPLSLSSLS